MVLLSQNLELSLLCQLPWSQGVTSAPSLLVREEPLLPTRLSVRHQQGSLVPLPHQVGLAVTHFLWLE